MKLEFNKVIGTLVSVVMIIGLLELGPNIGFANSSNALLTANVNVGNIIYISVTPTTNTFGNVYPGQSYSTNVMYTDADNGGNIGANIFVSGNAWQYSTYSFGVSNTLWDSASQGTYNGFSLTNTLADTSIYIAQPTQSTPSQSNSIFFGVNIPGGTAVGLFTENILFENKNTTLSVSSSTETVQLTANVQGACYIALSPNTIAFGAIYASANVPTNVMVTDTDSAGNAAANVLLEGTAWTGLGSNSFGVSNTMWDATSQSTYTGTALSNTLALTSISISATTPASANVFFGLGVPGGTPAGVYTQTITIENSC